MSFHPSDVKDAMTSPFQSILCNMWLDNKLENLWDLARNHITNHKRGACSTSINQRTKVFDQAVSQGRSGMWGKACHILQSSGIAPNNDTTWQLLKSQLSHTSTSCCPHNTCFIGARLQHYSNLAVLPQGYCGWSLRPSGATPP